jgi:hypothetical protein
VVHVWPRAVEVGGEAALSQIRVLMSSAECSTDHGILYEKSLSLSPVALHVYLRHAYGNVNWVAPRPTLQPSTPYTAIDQIHIPKKFGSSPPTAPEQVPSKVSAVSGNAPLYVMVLRSNTSLISSCKAAIRRVYHRYGLHGRDDKSSVHATDHHTEAIIASQMLLNDHSVLYMHHGRGVDTCSRIASQVVARDLELVSRQSRLSSSTPGAVNATVVKHGHPTASPDYLFSQSFLVDTGAAIAFYGLRNLTDIDLIWEARRPEETHLAALLTSTCGGKRRQRSRGCIGTYGSHNPPLVWFDFHNVSTPADLVHDPRRHAFCFGLSFVAMPQLLRYKLLRLGASAKLADVSGAEKDRHDMIRLVQLNSKSCTDGGNVDVLNALDCNLRVPPSPPTLLLATDATRPWVDVTLFNGNRNRLRIFLNPYPPPSHSPTSAPRVTIPPFPLPPLSTPTCPHSHTTSNLTHHSITSPHGRLRVHPTAPYPLFQMRSRCSGIGCDSTHAFFLLS